MASRRTFPASENLEDRALARSPVTENYRLRTRTDTLVSHRFDKILFKTTPNVSLSGRRTEVKIREDIQRQCEPGHSASPHPGKTPYVFTNGFAAKSTRQQPDRLQAEHPMFEHQACAVYAPTRTSRASSITDGKHCATGFTHQISGRSMTSTRAMRCPARSMSPVLAARWPAR